MKYEVAITSHNCTKHDGHSFRIVQDAEKKKEIRKQHPRMTGPLWQCVYCDKVTEAT